LNQDGTIDREKLGKIVFENAAKLKQLNKCLHGLIVLEMLKEIAYYFIKGKVILYDEDDFLEIQSHKNNKII
jgi:dephospho-CoA kinase